MKDLSKIVTISKNDQSIKEVLGDLVSANPRLDKGLTAEKIKECWGLLFGSTIEKYTSQLHYHRGTLRVQLSSSALREELSMSKQLMIDKLNDRLGEKKIKELILQ